MDIEYFRINLYAPTRTGAVHHSTSLSRSAGLRYIEFFPQFIDKLPPKAVAPNSGVKV